VFAHKFLLHRAFLICLVLCCFSYSSAGSVWRGRYEGITVAVKKSLAVDVQAQISQMHEIELLAGLPPHPHVLSLLGAYLEDNAVCSVSPFMPGGSMDRRMQGDLAWLDDPAQVTAIVCGLFDGLAHLHRFGVLHRDLAPRNILFDAHGRPVLCDFGLSRLTQDGGKGLHTMTVGLQIPIRWMAPEVLSGQPQYFYASDVWSMGVVVWQLLTRHVEPYPEVPDIMSVVHGCVDAGHFWCTASFLYHRKCVHIMCFDKLHVCAMCAGCGIVGWICASRCRLAPSGRCCAGWYVGDLELRYLPVFSQHADELQNSQCFVI
jgi:serine/threonine protein kinase